jgi:hypothetical protein
MVINDRISMAPETDEIEGAVFPGHKMDGCHVTVRGPSYRQIKVVLLANELLGNPVKFTYILVLTITSYTVPSDRSKLRVFAESEELITRSS